jgi:hypothetical protein
MTNLNHPSIIIFITHWEWNIEISWYLLKFSHLWLLKFIWFFTFKKNSFVFWEIFASKKNNAGCIAVASRIDQPIQVFVGLAYQGKDMVYKFNIEYSSLGDFGPSAR